jgi:glycosyltransferase involved in cell wall biosynthesis
MNLTIVIPLLNEEESIQELVDWITRVVDKMSIEYEILFIDDGSTDKSWSIINELKKNNDRIQGIKFRRNYGKSAALQVAFQKSRGDVVITMDADLQDSPEEIPALYNMIINDNYDLVSGWKKKRHDPLGKTIPSKLFNATTRKLSGIKLNDFNCGLKAYRKELVKSIEVYGEMHRYIPVIAKSAGFAKIGEKIVQHHPRKHGISKFGLERVMRGYLDLASITFVGKFGKRPMHFFGSIGTIFSFLGIIMLSYLTFAKLVLNESGIASRPLFFFGMLLIIVGVQLFIAGFLAEMISRISPIRNDYSIEEEI